jgi:hypothetical protein
MSFLRSLLRMIGIGRARRRDVSAMTSGTDASSKATVEKVSVAPAELKPGHRRMTHRDKRLLPKGKPVVVMRKKRPSIMKRTEADRLFSRTLRTSNREIRDLSTDAAQLRHYGLPEWKSESDVAAALSISVGMLRHFSIHRERERVPHYVMFAIPKRRGGVRIIHAPKRRLKAIQRRLNEVLVSRLPVSDHAHGFRAGRSVRTNAEPHVGRAIVLKLDIKDCFPTLHYRRVRGLLIALGYSYPVAATLAVLMTEPIRQPVEIEGTLYHVPVEPRHCVQGAPTSPGLCNAIMLRLDRRLAGLATKYDYHYTRYADDLTFSGNDPEKVKRVLTLARRIIAEEGFATNPDKTRIQRRGQCQRVTGVVVNETAGLSRKERRRLRAEIHQKSKAGMSKDEAQELRGRLAYLQMLNEAQARPLIAAFQQSQ